MIANVPRKKKSNVTILWRTAVMVTLALMALTVKAQRQGEARPMLIEDFSRFTTATNKNVAATLDTYTQTAGWTGANIFSASSDGGAIRIGTSEHDGYLVTSSVTATTGTIGIYVEIKNYSSGTATTLTAALAETDSDQYIFKDTEGHLYIDAFDIPASEDYTTLTTTIDYDRPCRVRFDPDKRAYIRSVKVYDGDVPPQSLPTSIATSVREKPSPLLYNINGQRVSSDGSLRNGIYIRRDGRKIIVTRR